MAEGIEKDNRIILQNFRESSAAKEMQPRYRLKTVVTLSGKAGAGKTFITDFLAEKYGLDEDQVIKARKIANVEGRSEVETVDDLLMFFLSDSKPRIIDNFRLAPWVSIIVRNQELNTLPIINILLFGEDKILEQRVHHRQCKENPELSLAESITQTAERKGRVFEKLNRTYPGFKEIDPLNPLNESLYYDFSLDVTNLGKEEAAQAVHEFLIKENAAEKRGSSF